jgi:hypothetical protein
MMQRLLRVLLLGVAVIAAGASVGRPAEGGCRSRVTSGSYTARVSRALASGRDIWGEQLLQAPGGPSLQGAEQYLHPLLLAGHLPGQGLVPLTDSGVYYLAFAEPEGGPPPGAVALHVADGSEIVSGSVGGRRLGIDVGPGGGEPYGSCLSRLATPTLSGGYLPILDTRYEDASGARYEEESFAAHVPQTDALVSFVRLVVDARRAGAAPLDVRFALSDRGLASAGGRLTRGRDTYLFFGPGARVAGSSVTYVVPSRTRTTLYAAWLVDPAPSRPLVAGAAMYTATRAAVIAYWNERLARGASFEVPEQRVLDAERSALIQNLIMGWRYSIGNPYQELEYPESIDAISVMGEYGFGELTRSTLITALAQRPSLYPDWEMGTKLLAAASYYRLYRDRGFLTAATPTLRAYLAVLAGQLASSSLGLLHKERWASDLSGLAYALDGQAVVWQSLRAIGQMWTESGHVALGYQAQALAARLGTGLRAALDRSERRLPNGSLFIPVRLDAGDAPQSMACHTRDGSYWNLVVPYVLASGLLPPGSRQAQDALAYLETHCTLLLGQIRNDAYSLATNARLPGGTDDVYMLDLARFLADNHQAGRLLVSLYGQLAAGMARGTFIAGETATLAPVTGEYYRSMYLPPNSAANAAFLETLRLTLVHEVHGASGTPNGLELCYAAPPSWLRPGRTISVRAAPTSFGRLSYSITTLPHLVRVTLDVPASAALKTLRLRLPGIRAIRAIELDGHPFSRVDPETETVDLSGRSGVVTLALHY